MHRQFESPVEDREALLFVARALCGDLAGELGMRGAGARRLRDSNYLVNAGPSSSIDHLSYEKALLGDWVRRELGRGTRS